jgi:uncharacterized DUF497 family protein
MGCRQGRAQQAHPWHLLSGSNGAIHQDAPVFEVYDAEHSESEDRYKSIGPISHGLVLVVWTERSDDLIRIISARRVTKAEQRLYDEFLETLP